MTAPDPSCSGEQADAVPGGAVPAAFAPPDRDDRARATGGIALEALRRNEDAAWQQAYQQLWNAGMSTARGRLRSTDIDVEDLVASALSEEIIPGVLGAADTAVSFQRLSDFDDLLRLTRRVIGCRCIDHIRRYQRRGERLVAEMPENDGGMAGGVTQAAATAPGMPGNNGRLTWAECVRLVDEVLHPPDPDLFHDRFGLGLTTREIADKRSMPHGTVVGRFAKALRRLAEHLDEWDPPA